MEKEVNLTELLNNEVKQSQQEQAILEGRVRLANDLIKYIQDHNLKIVEQVEEEVKQEEENK